MGLVPACLFDFLLVQLFHFLTAFGFRNFVSSCGKSGRCLKSQFRSPSFWKGSSPNFPSKISREWDYARETMPFFISKWFARLRMWSKNYSFLILALWPICLLDRKFAMPLVFSCLPPWISWKNSGASEEREGSLCGTHTHEFFTRGPAL